MLTVSKPLLRYCPPAMGNKVIVARMIAIVWPGTRTVLDPTWGQGAFWSRTDDYVVTGTDVVPERGPDGTADCRNLPHADGSFDLVVFDPPHNADAGAASVMGNRYGTYRGPELEEVVRVGSREAWRVGRLGCLIKVTDGVHGGRLVLMSRWVMEELGDPYDIVHKTRERPMVDPRWRAQRHAYNNGATFLAYRRDA